MRGVLYILTSWICGFLALLLLWGFITIASSPQGIAASLSKQTAWITVQVVETTTATPTLIPTSTSSPTVLHRAYLPW
jgi:hypothetical protein